MLDVLVPILAILSLRQLGSILCWCCSTKQRDDDDDEELGLERVGDLALNLILSKLAAKETARMACVNTRFRLLASEESLWSQFCYDDLFLSSPVDHHGNPTSSFKAFSMYPWHLVRRVKKCWDVIRNWLRVNFPEADASLLKGASEELLSELERRLEVKLPLPTKIIYRFCNGQAFHHGCMFGIIGGYHYGNHLNNVKLLCIDRILKRTDVFRHYSTRLYKNKNIKNEFIVLASTKSSSDKTFYLNCTTGQLYADGRELQLNGKMIHCVPSSLVRSPHDFDGDQQQDALLLWLEEHGRRLQNGTIRLRPQHLILRTILLHPEQPPCCTTSITNGVQVRGSAVLVPEKCKLEQDPEKYVFCYSIRMSLLPEGCIRNGIHFDSCQLQWMHWTVHADNDVIVSDVNANSLTEEGHYPMLKAGEKEFIYQGGTPLASRLDFVEGSLTLYPCRFGQPEGAPFQVAIARFPIKLPDYVF
ncbi:hypothetical protein ACFE04_005715 [Oxalis oulophora]